MKLVWETIRARTKLALRTLVEPDETRASLEVCWVTLADQVRYGGGLTLERQGVDTTRAGGLPPTGPGGGAVIREGVLTLERQVGAQALPPCTLGFRGCDVPYRVLRVRRRASGQSSEVPFEVCPSGFQECDAGCCAFGSRVRDVQCAFVFRVCDVLFKVCALWFKVRCL